jgi:hypothetical protein
MQLFALLLGLSAIAWCCATLVSGPGAHVHLLELIRDLIHGRSCLWIGRLTLLTIPGTGWVCWLSWGGTLHARSEELLGHLMGCHGATLFWESIARYILLPNSSDHARRVVPASSVHLLDLRGRVLPSSSSGGSRRSRSGRWGDRWVGRWVGRLGREFPLRSAGRLVYAISAGDQKLRLKLHSPT